ncbi:hypothetical protein ACI2OX_04325 [Bacillus sp. N9]
MASENNYRVILGNSNKEINKEYDYLNMLKQRQVDGMILLSAQINPKTLNELAKDYAIVLASEYDNALNISMVTIDNIESSQRVTEHLIQLGHTKIAYISGPLPHIISKDRLEGYKLALFQRGLEIEEELIREGEYNLESGFEQTTALMRSKKVYSYRCRERYDGNRCD